jgi:TPP-dependent 2-oxoacid decarboxylase
MSTTIARHLLDRLADAGVRHVFGVPGDYNLALLDAVEAHPRLTWVGNANELNAAYAADAYARLRGIAAMITTYGVGELSAFNGVAGSYAEHVPVVHIAGVPATTVMAAGLPVHHSLLDGDHDHFRRAFEEVSCATAVLTADDAVSEIDRVLSEVSLHRRPGYLALPSDLVSAPCAPVTAAVSRTDDSGRTRFRGLAGKALAGAKRVVVLVDALAQRYQVAGAAVDLARAGGFPIAVTSTGKGIVDETTPGFLGLYMGAFSEDPVLSALADADLVIQVGAQWADLNTGGFTKDIEPDRVLDLAPHVATVTGELVDAVPMDVALSELLDLVGARTEPPHPSPEPVTEAPETTPATDEPLTQTAFWAAISRFLRPDDLILADQGTPLYGLLDVPLPSGAGLIVQQLWASIGYALPATLGAQLAAEPGRRTVLIIGDGSLQTTAQELATIIRSGLDPVIFVVNNDGYTVERAINGPNAIYNDVAAWNYTQLPAAFGAQDAQVSTATTTRELEAALAGARPGRLTLIEVVVDRHDLPTLLKKVTQAIAAQNQ